MRHLTILSQTLEPLPSDRYLTLKLLYQPDTPEDYEPPFFKHANPGKILGFALLSATLMSTRRSLEIQTQAHED